MTTILDEIVQYKKEHLEQLRQEAKSLSPIPAPFDFYQTLERAPRPFFILECKKASPSQGVIRENFGPQEHAAVYRPFATFISVLTDIRFFQGSFEYLRQVSEMGIPTLCKDFILDESQIILSRHAGASAILLILSILEDQEYLRLREFAESLGMGVLTEVSDREETHRALKLKAKVIGINNRNLRDFSISLEKTQDLKKIIQDKAIVISESGMREHADINRLRPKADGFLIGSYLMAQSDLEFACRRLIYGENKICGLTDQETINLVCELKFPFYGQIFVESSPRFSTKIFEKNVGSKLVGVFANSSLNQISETVKKHRLDVVQLHGQEDGDFIKRLSLELDEKIELWKAAHFEQFNSFEEPLVNRVLLDSAQPGSGKSYSLEELSKLDLNRSILAGGLGPQNIHLYQDLPVNGFDFNSALELEPGKKNPALIRKLASQLIGQNTRES